MLSLLRGYYIRKPFLRLMELWATKVNLFAEDANIETESINYLTGVLQDLYCQLTHYRSC